MNELYDFNSKKDVFEFYNSANSSQKDKYEKSVLQCILVQNVDELHIVGLMLLWSDYIKTRVKKYSLITEVVYSIDSKKIDEEIYNNNLDRFGEVCTRFQLLDAEGKDKYLKGLYNHIKLAEQQKKYIDNNILGLRREIKTAHNELEEIKEIKGKIYGEFVAIPGIFTSIMFAVICGFNELTTLARSVNSTPVPKLLIFMSLIMLGITLLVFMSYSAVSKLTGLKLKSCQCNDDEECHCFFREKHPTVFYTTFFLICIMMTGFFLGAFYDKNPKINPTIDLAHINGYIIPLVLLLTFLIIVSVFIYKIVFGKQLELPREISIEEANYHINKLNNRMIALWVVVTILLGVTIIQVIL